ncbi:MAG: clostripain-related cysteine peptidase [Blastocatellia bacterium]
MNKNLQTTTGESIAATSEKMNQWTVMIYMAADNNLTEECVYALKEIQRVGAVEGIDTIALFDSGARGVKTKIYNFGKNRNGGGGVNAEIEEDGALESVATPFSVSTPVTLSGKTVSRKSERAADPEVLKGFLKKGVEEHQAERFLVVLSGHGSGAVGDFLKGDNPPSSLSIHELADALKTVKRKIKGGKIHILGMDSCLMSMAEVCAELADSTNLMVGAEGFELNTGWPYQRILEALKLEVSRKAAVDPEELARIIVKTYIRYYQDYEVAGVSVDHAACDLRKFGEVIGAVGILAEMLIPKVEEQEVQNAILLAHWRAQSYKNEQYVDLWDFCDLLEEGCDNQGVKAACKQVKEAVKSVVIMSRYHGAAFQHSHGLSIFFPWRGVERRVRNAEQKSPEEKPDDLTAYKSLEFHKKTKWGDFLGAYLDKTRREMRGEPRDKSKAQEPDNNNAKPVCIVPTDESRLVVREGPPMDRGEGRGAGSMKNPPVCFIPGSWGKENDEAIPLGAA